MNTKRIITIALSVFVAVSVAYLLTNEFGAGDKISRVQVYDKKNKTAGVNNSSDIKGNKAGNILVYYFHTTFRCATCFTIEKYTAEAVKEGFSDRLADGSVQWKLVNIQEPGNEHFIKDFKLLTKSVVIVKNKDGKMLKWKNLEEIWKLTRDRDKFIRYIQEEIMEFLKG
jgi:hypothetical protein